MSCQTKPRWFKRCSSCSWIRCCSCNTAQTGKKMKKHGLMRISHRPEPYGVPLPAASSRQLRRFAQHGSRGAALHCPLSEKWTLAIPRHSTPHTCHIRSIIHPMVSYDVGICDVVGHRFCNSLLVCKKPPPWFPWSYPYNFSSAICTKSIHRWPLFHNLSHLRQSVSIGGSLLSSCSSTFRACSSSRIWVEWASKAASRSVAANRSW